MAMFLPSPANTKNEPIEVVLWYAFVAVGAQAGRVCSSSVMI